MDYQTSIRMLKPALLGIYSCIHVTGNREEVWAWICNYAFGLQELDADPLFPPSVFTSMHIYLELASQRCIRRGVAKPEGPRCPRHGCLTVRRISWWSLAELRHLEEETPWNPRPLLVGFGEDERRERLCMTPKCRAKAFRARTRGRCFTNKLLQVYKAFRVQAEKARSKIYLWGSWGNSVQGQFIEWN